MKIILLALAAACFSLNVRFSDAPEKYRLYPRDDDNKGTVIFSGMVLEAGADSVVVLAARNGVPFGRSGAALAYQGDSAAFQVELKIPAELAEFKFTCLVDAETAAVADSVVAGDVYIVEGQSNAAMATCAKNEYVRSIRTSDTAWFLTTEAGWAPLPQKIIEISRIPVCGINEAVPGSTIGQHQEGSPPYARHLLRATLGKVREKVKAIFWYQGEWDAGYGSETTYPPQFDQLYRSYMKDYPGIRKIYVVQINTWRGNGTRELREADRRIGHLYGNVEVMPAIGGLGYNGHGGYTELGYNLYGIVARDLFDGRDTVGVRSPEIQRAYYTSGAKDHIALEFDQPVFWTATKDSAVYTDASGAVVPGFLKDYFALNDSTWEAADSCWFELDNRRIVLQLKAGMPVARNISYMPDWYNLRGCDAMTGPILWNGRKVPALTFTQFPVEAPAVYDTGAVASLTLSAPKTSIAVFERIPLYAVAGYAGAQADTNHYVVLTVLDPFMARLEGFFVRGMNPGTARIVASKGGLGDTLLITVSGAFAALDSMEFKPAERTLMVGDSMPVDLFGRFTDAWGSAIFRLDTLAGLSYDAGVLQIEAGMMKGIGESGNTLLPASFAGQACTLLVKVPPVPSFIRRINFQPKGDSLTAIPGWVIDSGAGYSSGKGFGSIVPNFWTQHSPHIRNYLRATWAMPGEYQVDCPDGNYLIRLCLNQWLWAQPGNVCHGSDTLGLNPQAHAGDGISTDGQVWVADSRVTVTGGAGLRLNVYGGISYLVLVSDDGADLNVVSKDGGFTPDPLYTKAKKSGATAVLYRAPMACPNPFNPATTVRFALPRDVSAVYALYDIRGKKVWSESLVRSHSAGVREVRVDLKRNMASGTYFGKLVCSDGKRFVHALVLIK